MGVRILPGQFGPLAHPELVLLVDHDKSGAADGFRGEEQGVRADDDARAGRAGFFFAGGGAENDGDTERFEKLAEIVIMLVGQHLGGGHERSGVSGRNGAEHGGGGNHGFSAAHIAVEEAVHRMPGREVVEDVGEHALLCGGEFERQGFEKPGEEFALPWDHGGAAAGLTRALAGEHALHFEEFFAGEVGAGRLEFVLRCGKVDGAERGGGGEFVAVRANRPSRGGWPELRDVLVGELREGLENEAAQGAGTPDSDRRMDRGDAVEVDEGAVRSIALQDLEVGMIEDQAAFFQRAGSAVDDQVLSGLENFGKVAEVEPPALHGGGGNASGFFGQHEGELAASAEIGGPDRLHRAAQAQWFGRGGRGKGGKLPAVLVASRIVADEIMHGLQTGLLQPAEAGRGQTGQCSQRGVPAQRRDLKRRTGSFAHARNPPRRSINRQATPKAGRWYRAAWPRAG